VTDVALDVLRHRIVLSYEAMAENLNTDEVVQRIMRRVPAPEKVLDTHARISANA
jgi:MoxR-like ATPase